ncbi:hypothetical protein E3N88_04663 [Mikania micrantha]|uniref:Endonuclease/exonuclease/phosphatase domain-containing protein n=1 Tax=Mikania micrantha TaxID=192012 RepID=A0A5N6PV36_9ASTR|nr:hypothetical protein E3N88_04663 [Mikania micrantha]
MREFSKEGENNGKQKEFVTTRLGSRGYEMEMFSNLEVWNWNHTKNRLSKVKFVLDFHEMNNAGDRLLAALSLTRYHNVKQIIREFEKGVLMGSNENLVIINIYGPQSIRHKREVWSFLLNLKAQLSGMWIILGDFNVVRYAHERFNSSFCSTSAKDFNNFILDADLMEYNMGEGEKIHILIIKW